MELFRFYSVIAMLVLMTSVVAAKEKSRPGDPAPRTCARASYPGDPVCDIGDDGAPSLPMPSTRAIRRDGDNTGYRVNESMSVRGKNDFNDNRYGGTQFSNPTPNPRSQDVNGGGALNYKF